MDIKRTLYWLLGLSLIFSISSLLLPIWGFKLTSSIFNEQYSFFSFGGYVSYSYGSGSPTTKFTSLSGLPSSFPTVLLVFIIMTLAIIIPLALELMKLRSKSLEAINSKISPYLLVAGLMSLASPLVFALLIPGAATSSSSFTFGFWGSSSFLGASATYGPNIGWFLQLVSLFLIVWSIALIFQSRKSSGN